MGAGGETLGLVGGGGTWEVTHRGRGEKSGGGVQIAVAVGNLIFLGRMMKMLIAINVKRKSNAKMDFMLVRTVNKAIINTVFQHKN